MILGVDFFSCLKSKKINFVSDDNSALNIAKSLGFSNVSHFKEMDFSGTDPSFLFICHYGTHAKLLEVWGDHSSYVSHFSACKFDSSEKAIRYSLEKLLDLDFDDVIKRRREAYKLIETSSDVIEVHSGVNKVLMCETTNEIEIPNRNEELYKGDFYAIGEWLEAAIVNQKSDKCSFSLTGEFEFNGLIYLCSNLEVKKTFEEQLNRIIKITANSHNLAVFKENQLVEITVDGHSIMDSFIELSQKEPRGLSVVEFAFGCAKHPNKVDFSVNALGNESTYGVHIGLGMGKTMPHIDLIAENARSFFINNTTKVKQALS